MARLVQQGGRSAAGFDLEGGLHDCRVAATADKVGLGARARHHQ